MKRILVVSAAVIGIITTFAPPSLAQQATLPAPAWPYPVADQATYSNVLFDLLEYQRVGDLNAMRWDVRGWHGTDRQRFWLKSEGSLYPGSHGDGEFDLQALYGRLVTPFFDLQTGMRVEQHREIGSTPARVFAVIGLQGLTPYGIEVEPVLFLSNKGKVSGRFTGTYDLLLAQGLILQGRLEGELAAQRDEAFGVDRGLNDVEVGVRVRREIRREFAPYVGVSYRRYVGAAADRVQRESGVPRGFQVTAGVRAWF